MIRTPQIPQGFAKCHGDRTSETSRMNAVIRSSNLSEHKRAPRRGALVLSANSTIRTPQIPKGFAKCHGNRRNEPSRANAVMPSSNLSEHKRAPRRGALVLSANSTIRTPQIPEGFAKCHGNRRSEPSRANAVMPRFRSNGSKRVGSEWTAGGSPEPTLPERAGRARPNLSCALAKCRSVCPFIPTLSFALLHILEKCAILTKSAVYRYHFPN